MKKLQAISLVLMAVCGSLLAASTDFPCCGKTCERPGTNLKIINLFNLSENDLNEIMQGDHPEIAVEFSAQTTLPISFFLKGDLVNLVENEESLGMLEVKQTFYVRCVEEKLILSTNLTQWRPFMEFITGTFSGSLGIRDGQPSIVVGTEANRRA